MILTHLPTHLFDTKTIALKCGHKQRFSFVIEPAQKFREWLLKARFAIIFLSSMASSTVYGAVVPRYASGNTVTYSTIGQTPKIVTFNSTTKRIIMWNNSPNTDCWVDMNCIDSWGHTGVIESRANASVMVPRGTTATGKPVEFDYATRNGGFICEVDFNSGGMNWEQTITYIVIGDEGAL